MSEMQSRLGSENSPRLAFLDEAFPASGETSAVDDYSEADAMLDAVIDDEQREQRATAREVKMGLALPNWLDAVIFDLTPRELLATKLKHGVTADKTGGVQNVITTIGDDIATDCRFKHGSKDGSGRTAATFSADGPRKNEFAVGFQKLVFDSDKGGSLLAPLNKARKRGWLSTGRATHSCWQATTTVSVKQLFNIKSDIKGNRGDPAVAAERAADIAGKVEAACVEWEALEPSARNARLREYLAGDYEPEIVDSIEAGELRQADAESVIVARHLPVQKGRITVYLDREVTFAEIGGAEGYRHLYLAVAELLGIEADTACTDMARMCFDARIPVGADPLDYPAAVVGNKLASAEEVIGFGKARVERMAKDATHARATRKASGGKASGGNVVGSSRKRSDGAERDYSGIEHMAIAASLIGEHFDLATFVMDQAANPRLLADGHAECVCPFWEEHSDQSQGRKVFAFSAGNSDAGIAVGGCVHEHGGHKFSWGEIAAALLANVGEKTPRLLFDYCGELGAELLARFEAHPAACETVELAELSSLLARENRLSTVEVDRALFLAALHLDGAELADKAEQVREKAEKTRSRTEFKNQIMAGAKRRAREERKERETALTEHQRQERAGEAAQQAREGVIDLSALDFSDVVDTCVANITKRPSERELSRVFAGPAGLSRLVRKHSDNGKVTLLTEPLDVGAMAHEINAVVKFRRGDGPECAAPPDVFQNIFKKPDMPVPQVAEIRHTPFVSVDGRIIMERGYHADAMVYMTDLPGDPTQENWGDVPETPSFAEAQEAYKRLLDVFGDFPFREPDDPAKHPDERPDMTPRQKRMLYGRASRANTIGMILQGFVRPMMQNTPIWIINKAAPRTGGGKLFNVVGQIIHGDLPDISTEDTTETEIKKTLVTAIKECSRYVVFDNLHGKLTSPALCAFTTAPKFSGRVLGATAKAEGQFRGHIVGIANKFRASPEIAERCAFISLDARVARPGTRKDFVIDEELETYVARTRRALVRDVLIILRHWISLGCPRDTATKMGGFQSFVEVVGGILRSVGEEHFLANRDAFIQSTAVNAGDEKMPLLVAWASTFGDREVKIGDPRDGNVFTLAEKLKGGLLGLMQAEGIVIDGIDLDRLAAARNKLAEKLFEWEADEEITYVPTNENGLPGQVVTKWVRPAARYDAHSKSKVYRLEIRDPEPA